MTACTVCDTKTSIRRGTGEN